MPFTKTQNQNILEQEAKHYHISANKLNVLRKFGHWEGDYDSTALNPLSGAHGILQVTDATWNSMCALYGKKYKLDASNRHDPTTQCRMGFALMDYYDKHLNLGHSPTDTEYYMAHFLGAEKARKVILADPETPITQLMTPRQISWNANMALPDKKMQDYTAGDLRYLMAYRMERLDARQKFQNRYDAGRTKDTSNTEEAAIRQKILLKLGVPDALVEQMPTESLLGPMFFSLSKLCLHPGNSPEKREMILERMVDYVTPRDTNACLNEQMIATSRVDLGNLAPSITEQMANVTPRLRL